MLYLRARYYDPGIGRFLTQDSWEGIASQPLSFNQWNYVNSNPINDIDPSGYSSNCTNKGTCGPDITDWYINEISNHYDYGVEIKNKINRMKALAAIYTITSPCIDIIAFLDQVAIESPFKQIVQKFNFPKTDIPVGVTPLITPNFANRVIDTLGVLEYAVYGLAVDYSNVDYKTNATSCNTGGCGVIWKGSSPHSIVSLCGQCRDASDFGNMMFGVGGAARGYSSTFVLASALLYNKLSGDSTSGLIDGAGAIPGWIIGMGRSYKNRNTFCQIANTKQIGRDNLEQIQGCKACNGILSIGETIPSSIIRTSRKGGPNGEADTIEELQNRLNGKLSEWFTNLLSHY